MNCVYCSGTTGKEERITHVLSWKNHGLVIAVRGATRTVCAECTEEYIGIEKMGSLIDLCIPLSVPGRVTNLTVELQDGSWVIGQ